MGDLIGDESEGEDVQRAPHEAESQPASLLF